MPHAGGQQTTHRDWHYSNRVRVTSYLMQQLSPHLKEISHSRNYHQHMQHNKYQCSQDEASTLLPIRFAVVGFTLPSGNRSILKKLPEMQRCKNQRIDDNPLQHTLIIARSHAGVTCSLPASVLDMRKRTGGQATNCHPTQKTSAPSPPHSPPPFPAFRLRLRPTKADRKHVPPGAGNGEKEKTTPAHFSTIDTQTKSAPSRPSRSSPSSR